MGAEALEAPKILDDKVNGCRSSYTMLYCHVNKRWIRSGPFRNVPFVYCLSTELGAKIDGIFAIF
jgi:hypothetical protein